MKNLFQKLSEENEYADPEIMKSFYYAFLRMLLKELRAKGKIKLPDFGELRIVEHKARRSRNVNTNEMIMLPPMKTVKFSPGKQLKFYFRNKT